MLSNSWFRVWTRLKATKGVKIRFVQLHSPFGGIIRGNRKPSLPTPPKQAQVICEGRSLFLNFRLSTLITLEKTCELFRFPYCKDSLVPRRSLLICCPREGDVTAHGRVQEWPSRKRLGTRLLQGIFFVASKWPLWFFFPFFFEKSLIKSLLFFFIRALDGLKREDRLWTGFVWISSLLW